MLEGSPKVGSKTCLGTKAHHAKHSTPVVVVQHDIGAPRRRILLMQRGTSRNRIGTPILEFIVVPGLEIVFPSLLSHAPSAFALALGLLGNLGLLRGLAILCILYGCPTLLRQVLLLCI